MNVQEVVREIHARLEEEDNVEPLSARESEELATLRTAYGRLFQARNAVGQMPPGPNTIRAKIGKYLIGAVQRSLFWYTPQIVRFQNEVSNALDCACNLIAWQLERTAMLERDTQKLRRELSKQSADLSEHGGELSKYSGELANLGGEVSTLGGELTQLRLQLSLLRTVPAAAERPHPHEPGQIEADSLPNAFQYALQDSFRGSERETIEKLQPYFSAIGAWRDSLPQAPWVDIGCGRGEWLEAAGAAGYAVVGIDSNPVAVAYCCARGLTAEETDALVYLRSLKNESLAVVTAFHVAEHWPMDYLLALMQEAVRVLKPEGLLIIETPTPATL